MASRPVGRDLVVVGHGLRTLVLYGPVEHGGEASVTEVVARRYRCLSCRSVCMVTPAGVWPGHRYVGVAVLQALALWSIRELPALQVRAAVSPFERIGREVTTWTSLLRWATRYGLGGGTLRERARRFLQSRFDRLPPDTRLLGLEPRIWAASLHAPLCPSG